MRGHNSICHHFGRATLKSCFINCGLSYLEYAAVVDEQGTVRTNPLVLPHRYDGCCATLDTNHWELDEWLRGKNFHWLICLDTELCADAMLFGRKVAGEWTFAKDISSTKYPDLAGTHSSRVSLRKMTRLCRKSLDHLKTILLVYWKVHKKCGRYCHHREGESDFGYPITTAALTPDQRRR
jgi:hypothetical protein